MHVISRSRIREFSERYPNAARPLDAWYRTARRAQWSTVAELRQTYPHADLYGRCTVFNIAGNNYRLIAKLYYKDQVVLVRAVLTHAEYDREGWKDDCDGN